MRKLAGFVAFGISLAAIAMACVDDDPASTTTDAGQGTLGGPCFANNTCHPGLECSIVAGAAMCAAAEAGATGTSSSGSSSGSTSGALVDGAAAPDTGTDAGPTACSFTPTAFPCGGDNPPAACYGATQSCTLTGCGGADDVRWSCNSPKECGGTIGCCLSKASATVTTGANCSSGTLQITSGTTNGSNCGAAAACAAGEIQLCAKSADCPSPQQCKPVKVTGAGASFDGQTLGVCTP